MKRKSILLLLILLFSSSNLLLCLANEEANKVGNEGIMLINEGKIEEGLALVSTDYFTNPPEEVLIGSKDTNSDGKVDEKYYKQDNIEVLTEDLDRDGQMDAVTYYEDEKLVKKEVDIDGDGSWDKMFWYYEDGGEVKKVEESQWEQFK